MVAGLLASNVAWSADNGVYLGLGITRSDVEVDADVGLSNFRFDGDDTKYKAIVGVRPLDWLAVELNYVDFGSIEVRGILPTDRVEYELKGLDAFVVGLLEFQVVDLFLKAGVVKFDREFKINGSALDVEDEDGYEPAFGAGIGLHFGSLGVRGEYERFSIDDDDSETDVNFITLGLTWTFL
jgi:OOP family OmpA-OmpF porin